jgi:hypothetical protein
VAALAIVPFLAMEARELWIGEGGLAGVGGLVRELALADRADVVGLFGDLADLAAVLLAETGGVERDGKLSSSAIGPPRSSISPASSSRCSWLASSVNVPRSS